MQSKSDRKTENPTGRILMLVENPYPRDTRVRNEATALVDAGYRVTVIALRFKGELPKEDVDGVTVYRVPLFEVSNKNAKSRSRLSAILNRIKSTGGYILEYIYFTTACFFLSMYLSVKDGFDVIHIHNPPNTLFLIGGFYRLLGKRFVFDHHDLAPELFLSRYRANDSLFYKILLWEEKLCLKLANMVIATNESYKKIDIERGNISADKVIVVRNGPDLDYLKPVAPDKKLQSLDKTILLYVGVMGPQDGVDYLLHSLHHCVAKFRRTDFYCVIVGRGDAVADLKNLARELGLERFVRFTNWIPKEDLLRYFSTADIGVDPNPSSPLNDVSTWIKVMEYMAYGLPVVSFDLRETRFTAQEAALYAKPNDTEDFAQAIVTLMDDPEKRKRMAEFGRQRVEKELAWQQVSKNLIRGYSLLQNGQLPDASPRGAMKTESVLSDTLEIRDS